MQKEIEKLNKQISIQSKAISNCQKMFVAQQEYLKELTLKFSANRTVNTIFLPILVSTNPTLKAEIIKSINKTLKALNQARERGEEPNIHFESQLIEILKFLQAPSSERAHLKVVED